MYVTTMQILNKIGSDRAKKMQFYFALPLWP